MSRGIPVGRVGSVPVYLRPSWFLIAALVTLLFAPGIRDSVEVRPGAEYLIGFGFATFAVSWAWINFTWFASAYDTDDWVYRLATMVQMAGVLVLAIGLAPMFESLLEDGHVDNSVMVAGYVVMRVPMICTIVVRR